MRIIRALSSGLMFYVLAPVLIETWASPVFSCTPLAGEALFVGAALAFIGGAMVNHGNPVKKIEVGIFILCMSLIFLYKAELLWYGVLFGAALCVDGIDQKVRKRESQQASGSLAIWPSLVG